MEKKTKKNFNFFKKFFLVEKQRNFGTFSIFQ